MIIGLSGKKRSGKDTFFGVLKEMLDGKHTVKRYAFADKVKEYAATYFSVVSDDNEKENYRFILQGIGQMFREEVAKDYWVSLVFSDIYKSRLKNPGEVSVITDVRYENEARKVLEEQDGLLLRLVSNKSPTNDVHQSETDLDNFEDFDFVIHNDGSLEEYEKEVRTWVKSQFLWILNW